MNNKVVTVTATFVQEFGEEVVVKIYNKTGFTLAFVDRRYVQDCQGEHFQHLQQSQSTSN